MSDPAFDVDSRLLQANERTLLAWLRTGMALVAFGFVVARMGLWLRWIRPEQHDHTTAATWLGAAFVTLGVAANALAVRRFASVRTALVHGRAMPINDRMPLIFGALVTALGALVGAYLLMKV